MITKDQRLDTILELLSHEGKVQIHDLVRRFKVTDMTIRRDFDCLVEKGKIVRTHGGAVLAEQEDAQGTLKLEPPYVTRMAEQASSKQAIAQTASRMIQPKQFVFLDSGTTTFSLAKSVSQDIHCTFITNGVNLAATLLTHQCPSVIIIGGEVDLNTWSSRGTLAEAQINNFHADIAFLACNAISPDGNVMIGNLTELGLKQKIMSVSDKIYLLADSSKFDSHSLTTYASVRDFDGIITDSAIPEKIQAHIKKLGGNLILAETAVGITK